MRELESDFNTFIGLSDHTMGYIVPTSAITLGAKIVEKHFILNRKLGGPDASFSMEPEEYSKMVQKARTIEEIMGNGNYTLSEKVKKNKQFARSLFIVKDIKKGEKFTNDNIRSIRPGYGLKPKYLKDIIGKVAIQDIERGTPLSWDLVSINL